jgi:type 1 glutamine amidotransferase
MHRPSNLARLDLARLNLARFSRGDSNLSRLSRRNILKASCLAAATFLPRIGLALPTTAPATQPMKKILFFTKSSGFEHSVIARPKNDPAKLSFAEQFLTDIAARQGIDVTCSKDGSIFKPANLAAFDAFVFYTTGDLTQPGTDKQPPMTPAGKQQFLDAVKAGKGFIGLHSATDTFHSKVHEGELLRDIDATGQDAFDPYIQMLGGEFIRHGNQQPSTLDCVDKNFPGAAGFDQANFVEEWYSLKNFAADLHVILVQQTEKMVGNMYQRKPYPETWARLHGSGRVFYTSMGHRDDVWKKDQFVNLLTGAMNWTTGKVDVDVTPNIKQVTPDADPPVNPVSK